MFLENGYVSIEKQRYPHPPSESLSAAPKVLFLRKEKLRIKEYRVYFSYLHNYLLHVTIISLINRTKIQLFSLLLRH